MVQIRPAASLIIIRDDAEGLQVYTLKRSRNMRFLPGYMAFPGGAVLGSDQTGRDADLVSGHLHGQEQPDDVCFAMCAIRETAEEIGLLCAVDDGMGMGITNVMPPEIRTQLLDERISLGTWLKQAGIRIRLDSLKFMGRWVTPQGMPARYDTRFFLFVHNDLSGGEWRPDVFLAEHEWGRWVQPAQMLQAVESGEEQAAPPTLAILAKLASYASAENCFRELYVSGPTGN